VLPLKDHNRLPVIPWLTLALIGANLAAYVYQLWLPVAGENLLLLEYGMVPGFITGLGGPPLPADWLPRPITLLTYQFLHGDVFHLGGNMLYLWIFGNNIEVVLGRLRYLVFYLLGGVLAGLCHLAAGPASPIPMIGASGAVAAILGAYLVLYPKSRIAVLVWLIVYIKVIKVPALALLALWFILQVVGAGAPDTAWMAHLGGFVAGMVLVRWFMPRPLVLH